MKDQERELYLHLGLPKAASSYLQQKIFPRLRGIRYYPKPYLKQFPEILEREEDRRHLFSMEMFGRLYERAEWIAEHFPDARPILVFRRHDHWIRSRYKYYIWKSGTMEFREYFDIHGDRGYWKRSDLRFAPLIDAITTRFQDPPLILLLEDLEADPDAWLERLLEYTGAELPSGKHPKGPMKVSFGDKQTILLRSFNRRFPYRKPQRWPRSLKQLHMHLRQGVNYLVAMSALILRRSWFRDREAIPSEDLEAIREYYREDWEYCREWAEKGKER